MILGRKDDPGREALQHRLGTVAAVDLAQLRGRLNDHHDAHVVARQIRDRLRDDRDAPEGGELVEQHHHLVLEARVVLGELARLQPDRLLEEEIHDGAQPVQVVRVHADVDRGRSRAKLPQVKVVPGGRPVEDGIQPEVEARGEGLADRARGHRREIDDVIERAHALPRQRRLPAVAPLDDALPVLTEPLIVGGHPLPQHLPYGLRARRRLEEIERDA